MAPRRTKSSGPPPPPRTLIIDNGAYTIKAGFSTSSDASDTIPTANDCHVIPNCLARDRDRKVYIGSSLSNCKDFGEIAFRRPVEKGYTVNWEAEKEIWEHELFDSNALLQCDPAETGLLLAEAPNSLSIFQSNADQIVFEEFGFARYYRTIGPRLNAWNDVQHIFKAPPLPATAPIKPAEIMLLIDSGYSHTTITPLLNGCPIHRATRRLDIGGKLLTNHLTRLLSLRQYDMRNEPYLINQIKEQTCFVTRDFERDLDRCWKGTQGDTAHKLIYNAGSGGLAKDYVLPDYHALKTGFVRDHDPHRAAKVHKSLATGGTAINEDVLTLRNERFTVPELLFSPQDIGLRQPGLAQIVMQSLSELPVGLWPGLLANIVVVGGNANFDGIIHRLQAEIMALAPAECLVRVARPADPIVATWLGGARFVKDEETLAKCSVTKQEYEEFGEQWVMKKFAMCR